MILPITSSILSSSLSSSTLTDANNMIDEDRTVVESDMRVEAESSASVSDTDADAAPDAAVNADAADNPDSNSSNDADDEESVDGDVAVGGGGESSEDEDIDNGGEFEAFDWYEYMDGMDDDDFDELHEFQMILQMQEESEAAENKKRKPKHFHRRWTWGDEEEYLDGIPDGFKDDMRMPKEHFLYLLDGIRDCLAVDEMRSMRSTRGNLPICPEIILCIGLRTLGQPSTVTDMARMYGLSKSSVKRVLRMFFNAIELNTDIPELQIQLPDPKQPERIADLADAWQDISGSYPLLDGFLGALDGFLARTEMPFDVENPRDYFSGHYQFYGLNVQAMCDSNLLFLYSCVAAPGKVNDIRAFYRCAPLLRWLEALPGENFIGADNAYPLSQKILVPFNKVDMAGKERHRAFNYYISQLRVRIEMAFGRLTTKWRCLRNALRYSTPRNAQVIIVCMKLHNFCIRMQQRDDPDYDPSKDNVEAISGGGTQSSSIGFYPTVSEDGDDGCADDDDDDRDDDDGAVNISARYPSLATDRSRRADCVEAISERNLRNVRRRLD